MALSRYRADLPPSSLVGAVAPEHIARAKARVDGQIDELAVLHDAIRLQQERVDLGRAAEIADGRTGKAVAADIDLMASLAVRAHQLKMDLGIRPPRDVPEQPGIGSDPRWSKYPPGIQRAMADPASRAKVLSIVQRLTQRALAEGREQ